MGYPFYSFIRARLTPLGNPARISKHDAAEEDEIHPYSVLLIFMVMGVISKNKLGGNAFILDLQISVLTQCRC